MNESTEYSKGYAAGMSDGYIEGHKEGKVDGAMTAASAYVKSPVTERTAEKINGEVYLECFSRSERFECSECLTGDIRKEQNYCPNCGARFKEVSDDKE